MGAAAGPVGPARPSKEDMLKNKEKEKKSKKEKGKDKKDKSKKKKDKKKKGETSSEAEQSEVEAVTQTKRPRAYKGHFMHPSFGQQVLSISVQLQKDRMSDQFSIMGQVVDSTV